MQSDQFSSIILTKEGGELMSKSKKNILEKLDKIPDDMSEEQIIERLYMLMRLDHSMKRCEEEGVYSDEEVQAHFVAKRRTVSQT